MSKLLEGKVLGSTPTGRAWALKALHPAAPEIDLGGVPSAESLPVVLQNFNQSMQIHPPANSVGSWGFDALFYPHPVFQGCVLAQDAGSTHVQWIPIINPQLGTGANPSLAASAATNTLSAMASEYRIAYHGITGYHDAPATANEGTLAVAQYLEVPQQVQTDSGTGYVALVGEMWPGTTKTFSDLQSMPSSYLGNSREGFYAPLKLSEQAFQWKRGLDLHTYLDRNFYNVLTGGGFTADVNVRSPGASTNLGDFPYGIPSAWFTGSSWSTQRSVHPRCSNDVIHISARNLDLTSSFTLYIRQGFEMRVRPTTTLSALQRAPPPEDVQAMQMYFETARGLKDGYPADFNDLGKILKDIAAVALEVAPKIIPQLQPVINAGKAAYSFFNSKSGGLQLQKSLQLAKEMAPLANRMVEKRDKQRSVNAPKGPVKVESRDLVVRPSRRSQKTEQRRRAFRIKEAKLD